MLNGEISLRKPWPLYRKLSLLLLGLTGLGVVIVYNTTFAFAGQKFSDQYYFLKKDLVWVLLGIIAFLISQRFPLKKIEKFARLPLLFSLVLLLAVLFVGKEVNGATRWFVLGPLSFQPSEFAKFAILIYLSDFLARKKEKIRNPLLVFLPPGILIGLGMGLILAEPDLGTVVLLAGVVIILYYVANVPLKYLGLLVVTCLLGGSLMIGLSSFRRTRFLSFLNPWRDPLGSSYHISQSLIGVGSGGLFGVGLGQGKQKLFFLPEAHTDFIFANIAEEMGLFGSAFFLGLFLLIILYGLRISKESTDQFHKFLALGITSLIGLQAVIHIGVVVSLFPTKGITLPFISYGGSSLLFTLLSGGFLVNLARNLPPEDFRI